MYGPLPTIEIIRSWYIPNFYSQSPKRKPLPSGQEPKETPPPPPPKKYVPFAESDSRSIEASFQKLAEQEEAIEPHKLVDEKGNIVPPNTALKGKVKVPVNEDYLFDVDVENRELGPAYWLGPVYDVRRGTWFYSVRNGLTPCDENLATQLEEGYLKIRPWTFPPEEQARSRAASQNRSRPTSLRIEGDPKSVLASPNTPSFPPGGSPNLKPSDAEGHSGGDVSPSQSSHKTFRLFGAHMNSMVTYQNATTAWLLTDDFMSRMGSTMYERFAGGGHFAGVKLTRGYMDVNKADKGEERPDGAAKDLPGERKETDKEKPEQETSDEAEAVPSASEKRMQRLERQMSALVEPASEDREGQEEEARKRDEKEMEDGYSHDEGSQGREIEHLILVTHGIGQRLGLRIESVNFVHDVNTLRKTIKDTYLESPDLQALNGDVGKERANSRIQVLPVCWRHLLDFPKQSLKHNRAEHDLGE